MCVCEPRLRLISDLRRERVSGGTQFRSQVMSAHMYTLLRKVLKAEAGSSNFRSDQIRCDSSVVQKSCSESQESPLHGSHEAHSCTLLSCFRGF